MRVLATVVLIAISSAGAGAQTPAPARTAVIHHQVSNVPAAQAAFDRGLLDYYAYNPEAAAHEFYVASDLDKHLAMAYWGIALTNGPNLNVPATDDRNDQASYAIEDAKRLENYATPEDRAFIDAAVARFDGDSKASQQAKLVAYRDALQKIALQYPDDPDAAALYAEAALYAVAMPVLSEYDTLTPAQEASFEAQAAALLPYYEAELAKFPRHVGLLHFFIHTAQMAGDSKAAVNAAMQLAAFTFPPEDSHLTHMPGHTFFDVGMYEQALDVGRRSVAMDLAEVACCHPGFYSADRYYHAHNVSFLLYAMTETGHLDGAIDVARADGDVNFIARQLVAAGRWHDVTTLAYPTGIRAATWYARAIAYAKLGDTVEAAKTIASMPKGSDSAYSLAFTTAMQKTVVAEIAIANHDNPTALQSLVAASAALSKAQALEAQEFPPLYFYSPHMALARLAVAMGNPAIARQALQAELVASPRSSSALAELAALH